MNPFSSRLTRNRNWVFSLIGTRIHKQDRESARALAAGMDLNPLFKELDFNKHKVPFAADLKMVWVEPGTFFMGSPITETGRQAMEARHEVTLSRGFYLGVHEVTQKQYEAVMKGNTDVLSPTPSRFTGEKHPVERVSWNGVNSFLPG